VGACNILKHLNSHPTADIGLLQELQSIGRLVSFAKGERVIVEGESGAGIYILRSGAARISMRSPDGKVIDLRNLEAGSFVGLSSALSCDHSCYTVETAGAAEFTFVTAEEAQELLRSRPDICIQVIQLLGREMAAICKERTLLNATDTRPVRIET